MYMFFILLPSKAEEMTPSAIRRAVDNHVASGYVGSDDEHYLQRDGVLRIIKNGKITNDVIAVRVNQDLQGFSIYRAVPALREPRNVGTPQGYHSGIPTDVVTVKDQNSVMYHRGVGLSGDVRIPGEEADNQQVIASSWTIAPDAAPIDPASVAGRRLHAVFSPLILVGKTITNKTIMADRVIAMLYCSCSSTVLNRHIVTVQSGYRMAFSGCFIKNIQDTHVFHMDNCAINMVHGSSIASMFGCNISSAHSTTIRASSSSIVGNSDFLVYREAIGVDVRNIYPVGNDANERGGTYFAARRI